MPSVASHTEDPLANLLIERQLLAPDETVRWLALAKTDGVFLEEVLEREGVFTRAQILQKLENQYFCPSIDVRELEVDPNVLRKVPYKLALRNLALPIGIDGDELRVALATPDDARLKESLQQLTTKQLTPLVCLRHDLRTRIVELYGRMEEQLSERPFAPAATAPAPSALDLVLGDDAEGDPARTDGGGFVEERLTPASTAPPATAAATPAAPRPAPRATGVRVDGEPVAIVDRMLEAAYRRGSTDIHVEPREHGLFVRFRTDGILHQVAKIPNELTAQITSRLKILGRMDISEKRLPQDGRFTVDKGDQSFDLRVSSLPSKYGEKIVLRLLRKDSSLLEVGNLQMPPEIRELHQEMCTAPIGMFLVTGPTGSGKTTTLYSTLASIDREQLNVATLEDPIEYSLDGITQVGVSPSTGLTFAVGLEAFLRQDPDVILVGEIRDLQTAEIASRAALTGHKVFSTLHTNDACQAVMRLIDMKVAPYLVTATLKGVIAQRLVRKICEDCRESYPATETEIALLGFPENKELQRGAGCDSCASTGYKGRMALFEYFRMEDNLHRLILDRASPYALRTAAQRNGMIPMAEFGKRTVLEGLTTVAEIHRVLFSDDDRDQLCSNCRQAISLEFTVCPFCRHVLKESCGGCGAAIDPSWEACPSCGDAIEREWKKSYCSGCVAPLDEGWTKCPYCGEVQT